MSVPADSNTIKMPFDPDRTPRDQIETAIASVKPRICERHPHEILQVDKAATVRSALYHDYPNEDQPRRVEFSATYGRCSECPHSNGNADHIEVECCPVSFLRFRRRYPRDEKGRPLPQHFGCAKLQSDRSAREQFQAWLAEEGEFRCGVSNQVLRRLDTHMQPPFDSWTIEPRFARCLQCSLECLSITPDEALASFENFVVDPPAIRPHVEMCRAFAAAPKGVLLLLGNCGTGKTHLAIAILRELLREGASGLSFVKHRHFLAGHWHALRPVAFGEEPPESPLVRCQEAQLLVYDEIAATTDRHAYEDLLLDLFETRIGHFKPSIITGNLSPGELEVTLGSQLFDRLRRAAFAVLEFGFDSKRKTLNANYLKRGPSVGRA